MGGHMSKKLHGGASHSASGAHYTTELSAYEAACEADSELRSFDTALQARTSHAINTLAGGVEVRALSFESLKEVTECLLEMNQEVVRVILQCKKDIWKSQELFDLVEDYFETSLQTLDFCAALESCLKRAKDAQLLVLVALRHFDAADPARALAELRSLRSAGDPFTPEFFAQFSAVYRHQAAMLEKLSARKRRLDRRSRGAHAWRKVSSVIFVATFAAVLICSVVAAAMAAPPVAAALAAATSIPIGSMGKWIDSLWRKYEDALRGQKEVVSSMQVGTYVAVKDLDNIRVLIDRLEVEIEALLKGAEFAAEDGGVRAAVDEIRRRLAGFMKNVEELGVQADVCSRDIRRARTVVLQRIIKNPNGH